MPDRHTIRLETEGPLRWIVFDRPDKLNTMNELLLTELFELLDELRDDRSAKVVILRGAGTCFSAGYDFSPAKPPAPNGDSSGGSNGDSSVDTVADWERLQHNMDRFFAIRDYPKPVIAAVHGFCLAGATQLCMFCDLTIVADEAVIGGAALPAGAGLIGPLWSLLVGPQRAKQMFFSAGMKISGSQAAAWGWCNYSVPEGELFDSVRQLAQRMALQPAEALRVEKHAINQVQELAGIRTLAAIGAQSDALTHGASFTEQLRSVMRTDGWKEAVRRYEAGEFS